MKRCPITYETINKHDDYSQRGLHALSRRLKQLQPLPLSAKEQRDEALARAGKMSIQGVQTKLSARLNISEGHFDIVDSNGWYILKTQSEYWPELPENEALTMSLAATIGIDVPVHGLVYAKDRSVTYFIQRFDRSGRNKKLAVEDFAQLSGLDRSTKYDSSMEHVIKVIASYCSFPKIEYVKLFKLTLFNFLVGNEDMHLKNFSLITREGKVSLAPAYDLLNSTILQTRCKEELALPLNGKKNNLKKRDFFEYLALERLGLNENIIADVSEKIQDAIPRWQELIQCSFLSKKMQEKYLILLEERCRRLGISNQRC